MTALYSLRTDGDQYRITKFIDGNVESSYLCTQSECECPAGHRHTCRHRQMLPQMLAHKLCNTHWFFAFDTGGQIVDFNGTSKHLLDQLAAGALEPAGPQSSYEVSLPPLPEGVQMLSLDDPADVHNALAVIFDEPLLAKPTKPWRRL